MSARALKRALDRGACLVNGKIERFGSREIKSSDKIKFTPIESEAIKKLTIKDERIIFEDEYMLIYDKEAGHPTLSTEGKSANLHDELKKYLKSKFLEPVHRLDKNTSGLVIFAKHRTMLEELNALFQEKSIKKEYEAILDGKWNRKAKQGHIENYLCLDFKKGSMQKWKISKPNEKARGDKKPKIAITDYEVIKTYAKYSHVLLKPKTGRTHQLRVHMADLGYPVLGDTTYAEKFKSGILAERHLLHARKLEFLHPKTKKRLRLEAPQPDDLNELL